MGLLFSLLLNEVYSTQKINTDIFHSKFRNTFSVSLFINRLALQICLRPEMPFNTVADTRTRPPWNYMRNIHVSVVSARNMRSHTERCFNFHFVKQHCLHPILGGYDARMRSLVAFSYSNNITERFCLSSILWHNVFVFTVFTRHTFSDAA